MAASLTAIELYEPVEIGGRFLRHARQTDTRWVAIRAELESAGVRSLIDIGRAEGWIVRRAATELGCFSIGIDASDRILVGEIACLHDGIERMALVKARLSAEDINSLPLADAVTCLSVVHHVLGRFGLEAAEAFVRALVSRAQKLVIFEMGTSEERELRWSEKLPDMPAGQDAFIMDLLGRCGLEGLRRIGESEAFHRGATRPLYMGRPSKGP